MAILNIELSEYKAMEARINRAERKVREQQEQIEKATVAHREEIENLVKKGKVLCVTKCVSRLPFGVTFCKYEIKNFDDLKEEVEEKIKKGLFDKEIQEQTEKVFEEQDAQVKKILTEKDEELFEANKRIAYLENRNWFKRLINK